MWISNVITHSLEKSMARINFYRGPKIIIIIIIFILNKYDFLIKILKIAIHKIY